MKKCNIYLDLDGTLLEIKEKYYAVYLEILSRYGGSPFDIDEYWQAKREGTPNGEILHGSGSEITEEEFREYFAALVEQSGYLALDSLKAGAKQFLSSLSDQGRLTLVTLRKNRRTLLMQLESLGIAGCFDSVINDNDKEKKKPWEKKVSLLRTHYNGGRAFIIGDSEADIRSGRMLGFTTIGVSTGIRTLGLLRGVGPDYIVSDFESVLSILLKQKVK